MSNLRSQVNKAVKPRQHAMNMPVAIEGFQKINVRGSEVDVAVGINQITKQRVSVYLERNKAEVGQYDVTIERLNPTVGHKHQVPVGSVVVFEKCYDQGGGIYKSSYANRKYSKDYTQTYSNLMCSVVAFNGIKQGGPADKVPALKIRAFDPALVVSLEGKSPKQELYNMLSQALSVQVSNIPDSDKLNRSVILRYHKNGDFAAITLPSAVVMDVTEGRNRLATPAEMINIIQEGKADILKSAPEFKEFFDNAEQWEHIEFIPCVTLGLGKDEFEKYYDQTTNKLYPVTKEAMDEMNLANEHRTKAYQLGRLRNASSKIIEVDGGDNQRVSTFFDMNILMYKSIEDPSKRPFCVGFDSVNGSFIESVEIHDIPTKLFDPLEMLPKKLESFGELTEFNPAQHAQSANNQPKSANQAPQTNEQNNQYSPQARSQTSGQGFTQASPSHLDDEVLGDDIDDEMMAELDQLLSPSV